MWKNDPTVKRSFITIDFQTKSSFTCLLMLIWEVTCGEHCIQKAHSMIMLLDSMLLVLLKHSTIFTSVNTFTGKRSHFLSPECTLACMTTNFHKNLVIWNQKISWLITTVTFVWSIWDSQRRFWLDTRHGHSVVLLNTFAQVIHSNFRQILTFFLEIISNTGHTIAADYWSLGILIFELLSKRTPFRAKDDLAIYEGILRGIGR